MATMEQKMLTVTSPTGKYEQLVQPVKVMGEKTLVLYIRGARVASKWVSTSRLHDAV